MHLNEIDSKLNFPKNTWTFSKDFKDDLEFYIKKGLKFFKFTPTSMGGYFEKTNKSGSGHDQQRGAKLPLVTAGSILTLNMETKEFQVDTNLQDPRIATILRSCAETIPEFLSFNVVKYVYNNATDEYDVRNFGQLNKLLKNTKTVKSKVSTATSDFFEEFEFEVFKELSEDNWYHATTATNFQKILKSKQLIPSGEKDQGSGWTQLNLNLQNAVYLTKNKQYAFDIGITLMDRFEEDAVIIEISGNALKEQNYEKIVVDEDVLRSELDDHVIKHSDEESFVKYNTRIPEFMESVTNKIESIGFKGTISTNYFVDVDLISLSDYKNE